MLKPIFWLSFGGGVNSVALAILLAAGRLPKYEPWRIIFADTGEEQDHTYEFIEKYFSSWLATQGHTFEIVRDKETVLERWERFSVTGSRQYRACTQYAKTNPIKRYIKENGGGMSLIGIDAGEAHRAIERSGNIYPLVELGIDRKSCEKIIEEAGLPSPGKSGCWHCPFMQVKKILNLARHYPSRFDRIERLEQAATLKTGKIRYQWGNKQCTYWRERAISQKLLFDDYDIAMP
jgi:hypothetical protein